jgi:hypothetical protein
VFGLRHFSMGWSSESKAVNAPEIFASTAIIWNALRYVSIVWQAGSHVVGWISYYCISNILRNLIPWSTSKEISWSQRKMQVSLMTIRRWFDKSLKIVRLPLLISREGTRGKQYHATVRFNLWFKLCSEPCKVASQSGYSLIGSTINHEWVPIVADLLRCAWRICGRAASVKRLCPCPGSEKQKRKRKTGQARRRSNLGHRAYPTRHGVNFHMMTVTRRLWTTSPDHMYPQL